MTDRSSPPGDDFRARILEYLQAELADAEPAERDDLLHKAEQLMASTMTE